jgi:hypothetical protein
MNRLLALIARAKLILVAEEMRYQIYQREQEKQQCEST